VSIEPDARLWSEKVWPREIQDAFASGQMRQYFTRAREVLKPAPYPDKRKEPPKMRSLQLATDAVLEPLLP